MTADGHSDKKCVCMSASYAVMHRCRVYCGSYTRGGDAGGRRRSFVEKVDMGGRARPKGSTVWMLAGAGLVAALVASALAAVGSAHAQWAHSAAAAGGVAGTGEVDLRIVGTPTVEVAGAVFDPSVGSLCVGDVARVAVPIRALASGTTMAPELTRVSSTTATVVIDDVNLPEVSEALVASADRQDHVVYLDVTGTGVGKTHVIEDFTLTDRAGGPWSSTVRLDLVLSFEECGSRLVTTWDTARSADPVTLVFGAGASGTVDWGDGSAPEAVGPGTYTRDYAVRGEYAVTFRGVVPLIQFGGSDSLISVDRWDEATGTTSLNRTFASAGSLEYVTSPPRTVVSMRGAFESMTANPVLDDWDTSNVTSMQGMFERAVGFDRDLSGWDTSLVVDMSSMFRGAVLFGGRGLSEWDVSSVRSMSHMFDGAASFSADLSGWDVSSLTGMSFMFRDAFSFEGDVAEWDTSAVTNMESAFDGALRFSGDLSRWDTSTAVNMRAMFRNTRSFNSDLSGWDTSRVTNMDSMFDTALAFKGDLRSWNVVNIPAEPARFRTDAHPELIPPVWGTPGGHSADADVDVLTARAADADAVGQGPPDPLIPRAHDADELDAPLGRSEQQPAS